ncbi:hypothetical protein GCM10023081_00420 [Arthrobacter ginkgonis]|uniref:Uncharacterized protein n=1 Tax=Arthrobacter ginkgonis TaxID=1630594 RepID=A0ABP7BNH8_9MICC
MAYQKTFFRAVEYKRSGLFGLAHRWSFVLVDASGQERRVDLKELLDALLPEKDSARSDAYMCIDRATELFSNGQSEWVGYPSGAVVADLNNI